MRAAEGVQMVLAACLLGACTSGETVEAGPGTLRERVAARAIVEPADGVARVASPWFAQIVSIAVDEGDVVAAGDVLAVLSHESFEPDELVSPVAGTVIARHASVGDDVSRADGPLFEIADLGALRLRIELDDADALRVTAGARVTAIDDDASLGEVQIARVLPQMSARTLDPDGSSVRQALAPLPTAQPLGRVIDVAIALPPREAAVLVPRSAVVVEAGHTIVHVPGSLGDRAVVVHLGAVDADAAEVLDGLAPGDVVRRGDGS